MKTISRVALGDVLCGALMGVLAAFVLLALVGLQPAAAQVIGPSMGCGQNIACKAKSLAINGATIGSNALAVTGTTSLNGAVTLNGFNLGGVGGLSVGGATLGSNALAVTGTSDFNGTLVLSGGSVRVNTGQFLLGASSDLLLTRRGAAVLQLGDVDAASPVAQTFTAQGVVGGTSNTAAPNLTFTAPKGTGTGAGGSLVFQVAPAGSTGSAQNAAVTALTITSTKTATFGAGIIIPSGSVVLTSPSTVAGLPSCTGADGSRSFVTDATTTTFAGTVTGGGANHVPVYCDGSGTPTWKIG